MGLDLMGALAALGCTFASMAVVRVAFELGRWVGRAQHRWRAR